MEKRNPLRYLFQKSKATAKQRGLEFTITLDDLTWPTHCPILGIKLCYERDKKQPHRDDYPTFDRWDNSKGYTPGNVFVISWRANRMKWHSTIEELEAIVRYMKERSSMNGVQVVELKSALQAPVPRGRTPEMVKARVEELGWKCVEIGPPGGRVTVYCPKHDHTGTPFIQTLMYYGQGCKYCGYERSPRRKKLSTIDKTIWTPGNRVEAIAAKAKELDWEYKPTDLPSQFGPRFRDRITIYCPKHHHTGTPTVAKLLYKGQGCRSCGRERSVAKRIGRRKP